MKSMIFRNIAIFTAILTASLSAQAALLQGYEFTADGDTLSVIDQGDRFSESVSGGFYNAPDNPGNASTDYQLRHILGAGDSGSAPLAGSFVIGTGVGQANFLIIRMRQDGGTASTPQLWLFTSDAMTTFINPSTGSTKAAGTIDTFTTYTFNLVTEFTSGATMEAFRFDPRSTIGGVTVDYMRIEDSVSASTLIWDGGGADGNFSTAANWNPDSAVADTNSKDVLFDTLVSPFQVNADVDVGGNPSSFTFASGASAMTITASGNNMQFATGTASPIVNNGSALQTFSATVRQFWIGGTTNRTWSASGGNLLFNQVLFRADSSIGNDVTLELSGAANGTINGTIGLENDWSGKTAGLIKAGAGTWTLGGSAANTYNGATTVSAGNLDLAKSSGDAIPGAVSILGTVNAKVRLAAANQISDTSVLTFGSGVTGRLQLEGFNETLGGIADSGGTGNRIVEAATDNSVNKPATLTLNVGTGNTYSFGGYVRDAAGVSASNSALTVIKSGDGTQVFSGNNSLASWSGPTTINAGALEFSGANGGGNSDITLASGTVRFSGGGTRSKSISGNGNLVKSGNNTLTLTGNNVFAGPLQATAGTLAISSGAFGNLGAWHITGSSTVELSGATVNQTNNIATDALYVGNGTSQPGTLNVTAGSLASSGPGARGLVIGFNQANGSVMTVNGAGASVTADELVFGWNANSTITLTDGTITASSVRHQDGGNSTFNLNGGTLTAGTVLVQSGNGTGTLNFGGGTLQAGTDATNLLANGSAANQLDVFIRTAGAVIDTDGKNVSSLRPLQDYTAESGGLTKQGAGRLTLTEASTYSGGTIVSNGTLRVSNTTGSGTGTGAVTVQTGATLDGTGTLSGAVTVNSGGTIAPGTSIGELTLGSSPTLNGTVLMEIDTAGSPTADKLVVTGNPIAYGGTLTIVNNGGALTGGEVFDLFDATGFSGSFTSENLPALGSGLNWWTGTLTTDGSITVNRAPVASPLTTSVAQGGSITVTVIGGKHAPTDADSDGVVVSGVGTATSGTAGFTATAVTYNATGASVGTNTFTYTVSDNKGGTDTRTVTVIVLAAGNGANLTGLSGTAPNITVSFAGLPGSTYAVDRSEDLSTWTEIAASVSTGANGQASYTDTAAPDPGPAFYRTRYVSTP